MNLRIRAISFLIFGLLISAFAMAVLIVVSPVWQTWKPATCMPARCFCESVGFGNKVLQPSNTISSFAFVVVGVLIFGFRNTGKEKSQLRQTYSFIFAFSLMFVGFGSAFYHTSLTFTGQFFDVFGMFLLATFMFVYALERLFDLDGKVTLTLYFFLNLLFAFLIGTVPETRRFLFTSVVIVSMVFELFTYYYKKQTMKIEWFYAGFAVFASAFLIWVLDISKTVCSPHSPLQGHAVWHLLGAVATAFLYLYYASERRDISRRA